MAIALTPAQAELRDKARKLAAEHIAPRAEQADRDAAFPEAQIRALAEGGFLAMLCPKEAGGGGFGSTAYSLAITEVARACASTSVTMAVTNMVGDAICAFGSQAQKEKHVPRLASADYLAGAFALSEPNAGSDAASLKAKAERVDDGYRVTGSKCWITSGDKAGIALVMAKTDMEAKSRGISAFLIDPASDGFSVGQHEKKMGLRGSSTVTLDFDNVFVPTEERLGDEGIGFSIAMRALDGGRIGIGSQAVGIGLCAYEKAVAWLKQDNRREDPSRRAELARTGIELDTARALVLRAARLKDSGLPFTRQASMAKLYATEAANKAARTAVNVLGPHAADPANGVERWLRDVRVTTIYEGTSEVQRIVIARQVLAQA